MNLNATLLIEVLSFLILLGLMMKFLYRPVLSMLDKRAAEIKLARQKIEENLALAEQKFARAEKTIADARKQALKIEERINTEAENMRRRMIEDAKKEADSLLGVSRREISVQVQEARQKIREQVVDLSVQAAEKILRREFSAEDQKRLFKDLIEDIE